MKLKYQVARTTLRSAGLVMLILAGACWSNIPHETNPSSVQDAPTEFRQLVMMHNRVPGPIHVMVEPTMATISNIRGTFVLVFRNMAVLELRSRGSRYAVDVIGTDDQRLITFTLSNQRDARRLCDVLSALRIGTPVGAPANPQYRQPGQAAQTEPSRWSRP